MKKLIIILFILVLIGVLGLEIYTFINLVKINHILPSIEYYGK